ncbi:MAG: SET domain-containing protein-lysine N-methyltransferase [Nanoarchaeota archaeon]
MIHKKIFVSKSFDGKGLFAKESIKKDEFLFIVKGKIRKEDKYYEGNYFLEGPRWLAVGKHKWIIPLRKNPWWFINHSCSPNAGLVGKNKVVAMKNINKNEEITLDYSITEDDPNWEMKCKCDDKKCRKIIKSYRFLPKKLKEKYKNYTPRWLVNQAN